MGCLPRIFPRFVEASLEKALAVFYYRGAEQLLPTPKPLYYDNPIINDHIWGHVRSGRLKFLKGEASDQTLIFEKHYACFYPHDLNSKLYLLSP